MEKRDILILVFVIIIAAALISAAFFFMFRDSDNGILPWPNGNGNGQQIDRTEWAFEITQISDMNDAGYDGGGVLVGIVDSGIDTTHPDLDHINITAWKDYVNGRANPYDDNGHGSHIAGIIAAQGEIDGIAPKVEMIVVKAISSSGSGSDSDVAEGIEFCVSNGADVIVLSLGGGRLPILGTEAERECEDAIDAGVFVVAAAGNDGEDDNGDVASPATVSDVIAVGAIDEDKNIASFSSEGDNDGNLFPPRAPRFDPDMKPELVAPGVKILSTWINNEYGIGSGTSQATAFVAGGVVLLLDAHPEYQREGSSGGDSNTVSDFKEIFMDTAEKCPNQETPHDDHYGYGLINVRVAENRL
ncbi:MAG: S8 family serine peptidase [Thermoplasmata archaeon]|nr:MAG: S8 family serine peptidase [Thermoplasmata archaeon]